MVVRGLIGLWKWFFARKKAVLVEVGAQKHQNVTILGLFLLCFLISAVLCGAFGDFERRKGAFWGTGAPRCGRGVTWLWWLWEIGGMG